MLKKERHEKILDMLKIDGIITIKDMMNEMDISDMTARRDLDYLSDKGLLIRIHGGAQQIYDDNEPHEKTHIEKQVLQINEKKAIAKKANEFIKDGETIFIGPGTTLEHLALEVKKRSIRVVTNSLPVFSILNKSNTIDLLLIGGEYRVITGAFVGSMAINSLRALRFSKAFVSANAVKDNFIATYSDLEGQIQQLALDNSVEKFLLVDGSKFYNYDFYNFYFIENIDYIVTDSNISENLFNDFSKYTKIIKS